MRQIKEVMRRHFECRRSKREVARAMNLSATAVWEYLQRAKRAELTFERAQVLDDATLETCCFRPYRRRAARARCRTCRKCIEN